MTFSSCQLKMAQNLVSDLFTRRLVKSYNYSPTEDIQILCPGRKGALGATDLNERLQNALNPPAKDKQEIKFGRKILRIGDKVMQYKNNYDIMYTKDDGETSTGIFNGDIGTIIEINKKQQYIKIRFDDKVATYDYDSAQDVELSYATTIHKSQRSTHHHSCVTGTYFTQVLQGQRNCLLLLEIATLLLI